MINALSSTTSLIAAFSTTFLTRCANLSVDFVSSIAAGEGLQVAMTATRASPDNEGWRICVSFESRYGTCDLSNKATVSTNR